METVQSLGELLAEWQIIELIPVKASVTVDLSGNVSCAWDQVFHETQKVEFRRIPPEQMVHYTSSQPGCALIPHTSWQRGKNVF